MTHGTKVLVALDGFCDPDRPCIPGELLRTWHWCGTVRCVCADEFAGTASLGTACAGRVALMDAPRVDIVSALAAVVIDGQGYRSALAEAEQLLDDLAALEVDRLVHRVDDVIVPFPPRARITGPDSISRPPET